MATVAVAFAAFALTACGGSSTASTLTVDDVVPRLTDGGIDCTDSSIEALEDGVTARAVTCMLGTTGAVAVAVADTVDDFGEVKSTLCTEVAGKEGLASIAYGANWLAVVATENNTTTASDVATALGGQEGSVQDFCG